MILDHSGGDATVSRALSRFSARYRELGVTPEMYDTFVDCMLRSVAELDPQWSPALERFWRSALTAGIEVMR